MINEIVLVIQHFWRTKLNIILAIQSLRLDIQNIMFVIQYFGCVIQRLSLGIPNIENNENNPTIINPKSNL